MFKKAFLIVLLCGVCLLLLAACGTSGTSGSTAGVASGNQVHMDATNFVQTSITIKKGESITLIDDSLVPHIISNGTWENSTAKPARESGAPEVSNVQIGANGQGTIGPFATAGTFKLYCTIHPGMNLTVVVQ